MQEVVQAYYDSGLPGVIAQVESDLLRQPGSWTLDEVEREAWALTVEWRLDELRDYVARQIYDMFSVELPGVFFQVYSPPERPHGDGTNWLPDMGDFVDEHEHWFLGEYWAYDPFALTNYVDSPFYWSQYHSGTDLGFGANAELNGRQYFYMGDTWDVDRIAHVHKWSEKSCYVGELGEAARCDDMIVISDDDDPSDGLVAMPVLDYEHEAHEWRWTPVAIPGVHKEISPQLHDMTSGRQYWTTQDEEPAFTVPTGAFVAHLPFSLAGGTGLVAYLPVLVLAYGTATRPEASAILDDSDPQARPMSWMGCSFNGTTFRACYRDAADDAVPFSADISPWGIGLEGGPVVDSGHPAKFVQIAAVYLSASDFAGMCTGAATDTEICEFADSGGGSLLYGSGRPYRKSGLYLAFIPRGEFGQLNALGRPIVHYWTGEGWSYWEQDAVSLAHHGGDAPPCDHWPQPDYDYTAPAANPTGGCWPELQSWSTRPVFGEISARVIRAETGPLDSKIILLGSNDWSFLSLKTDPRYNNLRLVYAWRAPLTSPWAGDYGTEEYPDLGPVTTNTAGYGPYIIDAFSDSTYPGSDPTGQNVTLWHTISVWQGPGSGTPYGTYTGSEAIPW